MADVVSTNPPTMAAPGGHYSHAVTAGGFVFVSGQLPIAPDGTKLNDAPFEKQAQQVLDNVAAAIKGAGSSLDKLTQVRVYVTDITTGRRSTRSMRSGPAARSRRAVWCRCRSCTTASRSRSRRSR